MQKVTLNKKESLLYYMKSCSLLVKKKHIIEVESDLWAVIKAYAITRNSKIIPVVEELLLDGIKFNINHQPKSPILDYMRALIKEKTKNVKI